MGRDMRRGWEMGSACFGCGEEEGGLRLVREGTGLRKSAHGRCYTPFA